MKGSLALRALLSAGLVGGCGKGIGPRPTPSAPELERFHSEKAFKDFLIEQIENEDSQGLEFCGIFDCFADYLLGLGGADAVGQPAPVAFNPSVVDGFSTTNIQEQGVRESDVVKTDGTYLYVIDGSNLDIVKAVPADEMGVVSSVDLGFWLNEMYLMEDTAIVLGNPRREYEFDIFSRTTASQPTAGLYYYYDPSVTNVTLVDVSDRSALQVRATFELEGSLVTSRLIDSTLHVVLRVSPVTALANGASIADASFDDLIPDLKIALPNGEILTRNLVEWGDIYYPTGPAGRQMHAVVSIDIDDPVNQVKSTAVLANVETVYVSSNSMYLADTFSSDVDIVVSEFGSHYRRSVEATAIYRFDLSTKEGARLVGTGTMPGRLLNRFALSEYNGDLRAATTIGHVRRSGENDATNNVYVLRLEDRELVIIGRIENIAPTEQIYSARFIGDRGFLVTFKKVDPLFTLDMSDPTNPAVVGKLKVPGYSDYIHPLGEDHLLTIGKDTLDMGDFAWYQGVQLSVFDVADFADPQRVDVEIIGDRGTESEALRNPHAFNYYAALEMLAVPMRIAEKADGDEDPSRRGEPVFEGLCVYHVSPTEGIQLLAQISTGEVEDPYRYYDGTGWIRSVVIGDHIYAITNDQVLVLPIDRLDEEPQKLLLPN